MPHTRPRQTFNNEGVCGACEWNEKKIQLIGIRDGKNLKLYVKNIKKETKVDTML